MPIFAHLPLILKPSGKGKLSKRDGAKFGFPVFPLEWQDKGSDETYDGFREKGFLPAAVINFLSLLGWNPGTDQELFGIEELCEIFDLDRINKSGAQFDFDKAVWFNQQYLKSSNPSDLYSLTKDQFNVTSEQSYVESVILQLQPRVSFLDEFVTKSSYFFRAPDEYDDKNLKKRFKQENEHHFQEIAERLSLSRQEVNKIQSAVKGYINKHSLK